MVLSKKRKCEKTEEDEFLCDFWYDSSSDFVPLLSDFFAYVWSQLG
jgi:hypothetical protein